MKKVLFYLLVSVAFLSSVKKANAQTPTQDYISFTYDAAGNRVLRKLIISNDPDQHRKGAFTQKSPAKDSIGLASVSIYPNPTPGMLTIEIKGQNTASTNAVLYDNVGKQVFSKNNINGTENIDMYSLSAGHYKLLLTNGSSTSVWKIVKE